MTNAEAGLLMHNFRNEARKSLSRAKSELGSGDDDRLRYAALELRHSMEALTYDRAYAYRNEMPPQEYETWQPRKVMQLLIEIDPNADKNSALAVGVEEKYGKPAEEMKILGSEEVLNLATIKKHYDALGFYLHMPTLKQINKEGHHNYVKLRKRCNQIADAIEKALASPVFNITIGQFVTIDCTRCSKTIRRRMPLGEEEINAKCFECGAEYIVCSEGEGKSRWKPLGQEIECPAEGCNHSIFIWQEDIKPGSWWICKGCGEEFEIFLAMRKREARLPNGR